MGIVTYDVASTYVGNKFIFAILIAAAFISAIFAFISVCNKHKKLFDVFLLINVLCNFSILILIACGIRYRIVPHYENNDTNNYPKYATTQIDVMNSEENI